MQIQPLTTVDKDTLNRIITGYVSPAKYKIIHTESDAEMVFRLELVTLETPYIKKYLHLDDETFEEYEQTIAAGFSLGVYDADLLVGLALAMPWSWNQTFWVQEFHVAESHRGRGIGQALMQAVIEKARSAKCRIVLCETQNTNVPAIRFYRRMGFTLDGIDLSLYSNADYPDNEIALFMKRKIT
jgi:streptothricin acetyltransferase